MITAPQISSGPSIVKPGSETGRPQDGARVLLGEDWISPDSIVEPELRAYRGRSGLVALNRSPLARKIVIFNMMALVILVAGVLFMNPFRDSLVLQREMGLVTETELVANVFEAQLPRIGTVDLATGQGIDVAQTLAGMSIGPGVDVFVFGLDGGLVASGQGAPRKRQPLTEDNRSTIITDFLNSIWDGVSRVLSGSQGDTTPVDTESLARKAFPSAARGETSVHTANNSE